MSDQDIKSAIRRYESAMELASLELRGAADLCRVAREMPSFAVRLQAQADHAAKVGVDTTKSLLDQLAEERRPKGMTVKVYREAWFGKREWEGDGELVRTTPTQIVLRVHGQAARFRRKDRREIVHSSSYTYIEAESLRAIEQAEKDGSLVLAGKAPKL